MNTIPHGTLQWFEMVGKVMVDAATQAGLAPDCNISLLERYIDAVELSPGLVQGLRFDIIDGKPAFRLGAGADERGDITVEVTKAASYALNTLRSDDPHFHAAFTTLQASGQLKIGGDLSQLGSWFSAVHDQIVDRTR
jgi:hypothetical protein